MTVTPGGGEPGHAPGGPAPPGPEALPPQPRWRSRRARLVVAAPLAVALAVAGGFLALRPSGPRLITLRAPASLDSLPRLNVENPDDPIGSLLQTDVTDEQNAGFTSGHRFAAAYGSTSGKILVLTAVEPVTGLDPAVLGSTHNPLAAHLHAVRADGEIFYYGAGEGVVLISWAHGPIGFTLVETASRGLLALLRDALGAQHAVVAGSDPTG